MCTDCNKQLCEKCSVFHENLLGKGKHTILVKSNIKESSILAILAEGKINNPCNVHFNKNSDFFCSSCNVLCCKICTQTMHFSHTIKEVDKAAQETRMLMEMVQDEIKTKRVHRQERTKEATRVIGIYNDERTEVENKIKEYVRKLTRILHRHEEDLLHEFSEKQQSKDESISRFKSETRSQGETEDVILQYIHNLLQHGTDVQLAREKIALEKRYDDLQMVYKTFTFPQNCSVNFDFESSSFLFDFVRKNEIGKLKRRVWGEETSDLPDNYHLTSVSPESTYPNVYSDAYSENKSYEVVDTPAESHHGQDPLSLRAQTAVGPQAQAAQIPNEYRLPQPPDSDDATDSDNTFDKQWSDVDDNEAYDDVSVKEKSLDNYRTIPPRRFPPSPHSPPPPPPSSLPPPLPASLPPLPPRRHRPRLQSAPNLSGNTEKAFHCHVVISGFDISQDNIMLVISNESKVCIVWDMTRKTTRKVREGLRSPRDVAAGRFPRNGERVMFISDTRKSRTGVIREFSIYGRPLRRLSASIKNPQGIAVSLNGDVCVCDTGDRSVLIISAEHGRTLKKIKENKAGIDLFRQPHFISIAKNGDMIVTDIKIGVLFLNEDCEKKFLFCGVDAPSIEDIYHNIDSPTEPPDKFTPAMSCVDYQGTVYIIDRGSKSLHLRMNDGKCKVFRIQEDYHDPFPESKAIGIASDLSRQMWVATDDGVVFQLPLNIQSTTEPCAIYDIVE